MFLKKVHVKNFRGLQDVVLEFNQSLSPSVFPVGSLNGGGKSTLLQLIFILLRCAADPQKHHYIQNILKSNWTNSHLTEGEILHCILSGDEQEIDLRFLIASKTLNGQQLNSFYDLEIAKEQLTQEIGKNIDLEQLNIQISTLKAIIRNSSNTDAVIVLTQSRKIYQFLINFQNFLNQYQCHDKIVDLAIARYFLIDVNMWQMKDLEELMEDSKILNELLSRLEALALSLRNGLFFIEQLKQLLKMPIFHLKQGGYHYITNLSTEFSIFCQISHDASILNEISEKIYLACPLTQIFLFLKEQDRRQILGGSGGLLDYVKSVDAAKQEIGNWYTYEFFPVEILGRILQRCRDQDTSVALSSGGSYGTSLMQTQQEINQFFLDKTVSIEDDFKRIIFRKKGSDQALLPEDLSHGELKKFGIYLWLKYMEIKDTIVLMDEVEIGFHPDWQYEIIHELLEWSNNNQFILATHSYDLCSAVTPAHVNEIEPRLNSKRQDSQDSQ